MHTGNLFSGSNLGKAGRSTPGNSDDRPLEGKSNRSASAVILAQDTATVPNYTYPKMPFLAIDWHLDSTKPGSLIDWGSAASLRLESPGPMEITDGLEVQSCYIGFEPKSRGTNGKPIPLL